MADIVIAVTAKVVECLVAPVGRQCGYVIFSNRYVRQLEHEVQMLDYTRESVQDSINGARNNVKSIKADVMRWMEDAQTVANKAQDLLEYDRRAKKSCFCEWLPNPKVRYCLGREARRTTEDLLALIACGRFERVYYERPPPGIVSGDTITSSRGYTITSSRASIFQEIMNALDDKKFRVIGICGPGGVGKTTLLKEVQRKLRIENRSFDLIATMTVSRTPDLKKIQDDIAFALSLDLKNEPSEVRRRDLLFQKLRSDPTKEVLIILDDLWGELDLQAVGIPLGDESRGCKLLLTSRFKDVLEQRMHADRIFHLEVLNNDEAFTLFEQTVGHRLKDDEELKPIAAKVVKKLVGLPLLITTVAGPLKISRISASSNSAWIDAVTNIDNLNIETIVKLNYDRLVTEDTKSLFLLCGLIGGTIQVELLLGLGMGLGLFDKYIGTIENLRNILNSLLHSLRFVCLLQDGGNDEENVTVHDLYSEVVISTPFIGENSLMMNSNYGSWSKEKLEKCWAICLVNVVCDRLAELMLCHFLDLKILMLSQPEDWLGSPAHRHDEGDCCRLDFTYMKELRVLYLRSMHITTLPSSIEILKNLRSIYLDNCLVKDVAVLGKLEALQFLSFAGSTISTLPKEMGELKNLRLLNLSNCKELQKIEPGILKNLTNLEELYMKGSFDRWVGKDEIPSKLHNARFAELKRLTKLTTLEISILDPTVILETDKQLFGYLSRFWINIGNLDGREFEGLRTMKLKLKGCGDIFSIEWVQKTLQKTQYLHVDGLRELKNVQVPELKHLDIDNSESIKYIVNSSISFPHTAFKILESLFLKNLINLEKICNGPIAPECFSKLKAVHIEKCHQLKNLWFLSYVQRLVHLEEIQVRECDSMQAIIPYDTRKEVDADDIVELPNVHRLDSQSLQNRMSFSSEGEAAAVQDGFLRLKTLEITGLNNLGFMILPSMVNYLAQLRELRVSDCMNMGTIIAEEEGWGTEASKTLAFPMLKVLHLQHLERLTCFSHTKCSRQAQSQYNFKSHSIALFNQEVVFPSLEELHITDIGYVKMIWENHVASSFQRHFEHLKTLNVSHCIELSNMFTPTMAGSLVKLTKVRISNCKMLTKIISDEGCKEGPIVAFKQLKYMELEELIGLTCFSSGRYTLLFPILEDLIVTGCLNMKLFSEAPIRAPKLKRVQLPTGIWFWNGSNRNIMQNMSTEMATIDGVEFMHFSSPTEKWHSELITIKSLWQLKSLVMDNCPFLNAIPSGLMLVLDKINTLQVQDCKQLEEIFNLKGPEAMESTRVLPQLWCLNLINLPELRRLWNKDLQEMLCFKSLSYLTIYNCSNLTHAFTPSMVRCLPTLQWMEIKECDQMEGVIGEEEGNETEVQKITFSILRGMELERLPNLTGFPSGEKYLLDCPMLRELTVAHCPKIITTFNWQSFMKIDRDKIDRDISSPFTPQVLFPPVKSMVLSHMDNSRKTWVDGSQHIWKVEAFDKLQVEFRVIQDIGLPTIT